MPEDGPILARRAAEGDLAALQELLQRYLPQLRAYVRLRAGGAFRARESTCDLVQSVCREVLENAERFQFGAESGFRHWLFTTAQRKIADRVDYYYAAKRDVGREVRAAGTSDSEPDLLECYRTSLTPSRHAIGVEQLEALERAFEELPPDYREVVLLHKVMGLPHDEVAARLGRTTAATRTLLSRALSRLADRLVEPP